VFPCSHQMVVAPYHVFFHGSRPAILARHWFVLAVANSLFFSKVSNIGQRRNF
jgi:hypothetical protein